MSSDKIKAGIVWLWISISQADWVRQLRAAWKSAWHKIKC